MRFLDPSFLWALLALAIPVIIHLFQLRRFKRIEFPNIRFLQEVSRQTRQRRKVQHWLVLLARLGALACLVLAFAQPYIPTGRGLSQAGQRAVSIYIDDSYSMDGQNAQGRLLDQARSGARDAVMAYQATDRFQVLTGRFEGRQQLLTGRDEALEAASQVDVGSFARPISQVLARQREALARGDAQVKRALIFSDLQRSTTDVEHWTNDSLVPTLIVPLPPSAPDNLSIDSVWFASPVRRLGQAEELHVRIRNRGDRALENVPLRLTIDGRQRALATFAVEADAMVDTVLRTTNDEPGDHWGEVSLSDQPVTFDDRLFIAYSTIDRLRVLLVTGGDDASDDRIAAVFSGDSTHLFTQQNHRNLDLGLLGRSDLVLLNALPEIPTGLAQTLEEYAKGGGSLAVFPALTGDPASYGALMARFRTRIQRHADTASMQVERIDLEQPFYRDVFSTMPRNVDLPRIGARYDLAPPPGTTALLRLRDGHPFLADVPTSKGHVYLFAAPLEGREGVFTRHALFVTSLLRMAELSGPSEALYHPIGEGSSIPLTAEVPAGEAALHLRGPEGIDLVPELRRTAGGASLVLHDLDLRDGAYAVTRDEDTLQMIALDLPRIESDLSAFTPEKLDALLVQRGLGTFRVLSEGADDLSISLKQLDEGRKLWKWFVLLALLFLATEVMLIRTVR